MFEIRSEDRQHASPQLTGARIAVYSGMILLAYLLLANAAQFGAEKAITQYEEAGAQGSATRAGRRAAAKTPVDYAHISTRNWMNRSDEALRERRQDQVLPAARRAKHIEHLQRIRVALQEHNDNAGVDEAGDLNTGADEAAPGEQAPPDETRQIVDVTYRTLCVRKCDGYFTPVSFATTRDNFESDQEICERRCGPDAGLYVYRNPGGMLAGMKDLQGEPYLDLETAFLFQTSYDPRCTCKPPAWSRAAKDRHRLYALTADMKGKRGANRRVARARLQKFKREMASRAAVEGIVLPTRRKARRPSVPVKKAAGDARKDRHVSQRRLPGDFERAGKSYAMPRLRPRPRPRPRQREFASAADRAAIPPGQRGFSRRRSPDDRSYQDSLRRFARDWRRRVFSRPE